MWVVDSRFYMDLPLLQILFFHHSQTTTKQIIETDITKHIPLRYIYAELNGAPMFIIAHSIKTIIFGSIFNMCILI